MTPSLKASYNYLPCGPNERPFKIPSFGILIKFIGHRITHRIKKPKRPGNIKSEIRFFCFDD